MSVEIETSALSMSKSLDSLETTPSAMHRIMFKVTSKSQWYAIMREARLAYGSNWRSQPRVKRKLERNTFTNIPTVIWFEVPDPTFATWCAVKLAVEASSAANK